MANNRILQPADWSPVCGEQMSLYNEMRDEFDEYGAQIVGISVDGVWCHKAFAHAKHIHFPLVADFEPKGAVSNSYGVYGGESGTSKRVLFVIDQDGIIRWSYLSPTGVNPGAGGILDAQLTPDVGDRDHVDGPRDAAATLLEYGDYECPYCGMAYPIVKELRQRFRGQLRFVFRNFPPSEAHPHAEHAGESAEAVAELAGNASFWAMHDALYENQNALDDESLAGYADEAGAGDGACVPISRAVCEAE